MKLSKKLLVVPPVLIGVAYAVLVTRGRTGPEQSFAGERAQPVEFLLIEPGEVVPRAVGFGEVVAHRTWRAIAEVSGRALTLNPLLKEGEIVQAGTELVQLDPTDYQLSITRLEAEIMTLDAEVAKLDVASANTEASLEISRKTAVLAKRELSRLQGLQRMGNASDSAVDGQEQALLQEQSNTVTLESSLRMDEASRTVQKAKLAATRAQLEQARRDRERTRIVAPFDCRVDQVEIETAQYVTAGTTLFEAYSIDQAEVEAQLAISRVRQLVRPDNPEELLEALTRGELWEQLGITAEVRLHGAGLSVQWPARFARLTGSLDPATRTVGMVAAVDEPYRSAPASGRPALVKGMFVEVEFRGQPLAGRVTVPLTAIHDGRVYLVGEDRRLVIQPVELDFVLGDDAVLAAGLAGGERVILTDLLPAVPGMLLAATPGR